MKKITKRGVTLVSLVIYIILFTTITVFVSFTSNSMNEKLFDSRGEAINYESLNKLQYNLENSALDSDDVLVNSNEINYSNGDSYVYDQAEKIIYKNGGILCLNVDEFEVGSEKGVGTQKVTVSVTFTKYLHTISKTIITCVEGV